MTIKNEKIEIQLSIEELRHFKIETGSELKEFLQDIPITGPETGFKPLTHTPGGTDKT